MRNVTILLAVAAVLALAGQAQATCWWTGGTATWHSDDNWSGLQPTSSDVAVIDDGETAQISGDADVYWLLVGYGGSNGRVEMSGGTLDVAYRLSLGHQDDTEGYFDQSGGAVTIAASGLRIGSDNPSRKGTYEISGGSLDVAGGLVCIGTSSGEAGLLRIKGITPTSVYIGWFDLASTGTIEFVLDGSGVREVTYENAEALSGNIGLDDLAYSPYVGETIDLLRDISGGIPDYSGLDLTNSAWKLVDDGVDTIQAEFIPEPVTLSLLGIGLVGVVLRRRRS